MVIPGYDPEDIDDMLEQHLTADEIETFLTESEWTAYQEGDATLVDLLSGSEIQQLLDRRGVSLEENE